MDSLPDPSDWIGSKAPYMATLESFLHCNICKEIFRAPLMTSCSHTFCSICIRKCLQTDTKCPICRHEVQASTLRKNQAVEDITETYNMHRQHLIEMVKSLDKERDEDQKETQKEETQKENQNDIPNGTSDARNHADDKIDANKASENQEVDDVPRRSKRIRTQDQNPEYGFCPSCNEYMKIREIEGAHLTECLDRDADAKRENAIAKKQQQTSWIIGTPQSSNKPQKPLDLHKKLPLTSYNLLSEKKLRELLSKMSLPSTGSRDVLERRHREWVTLWNANTDSKNPVSLDQLRKKIKQWEQVLNSEKDDVKLKDLDKQQWSKEHSNDFMDLISKARQSSRKEPPKI